MERYNWTEVFPDTPNHFHGKVEEALLRLPEEEERIGMEKVNRRLSWKKAVIIALAAVFVLGTSALAAGKIFSVTSHSSGTAYTKIPDAEEVEESLGAKAKLVEEFGNGFKFDDGRIADSQAMGENGEVIISYQTLSLTYKKGRELLGLYMNRHLPDATGNESLVESFQDVDIYYYSYANKCVAGDYVMTEQDKADEASGKYVFSYGVEMDEPIQMQGVTWTDGDVDYQLIVSDSELTREDLVQMAKEIIEVND